MADNVTFQSGLLATPPDATVVAADDIAGVLFQRVKLAQGADGVATDVSSAAPLQVTLENHGANATAVKVDGSAVTQPVSHAALTELAAAIDTEVQVDIVGALPAGTNNIGDVDVLSIAAGDNNIGNVDIVTVPAPLSTTGGGTEAAALRVTIATDSTGVVSVDDNGSTLSVDDGAGSITVDAPVATPVFVRLSDGAAAISTLPVSLATVPSHAVTNAGTFVVQENGAALTSLQLIDDTVTTLGTDTYTEAASKGLTIGAVRRDADTTLVNTTNEFGPLQMDANGRLKVEAFSGETLPVSLTSTTVTGTVAVTQSGTWDEVGINDSGNSITVDNGGTFAVQAAQSGTWTVQPGNTANTTAWLVNDAPVTSGGLSKFHLVGAASDNATNVKASAGQVYCITAFNLNASPRYLKFHNTAGTPTAGSGVTDTFLIPGNTAGAGVVINLDKGIAFGTGIGITLVTGIADNNSTAIGASEVVVNIYYK